MISDLSRFFRLTFIFIKFGLGDLIPRQLQTPSLRAICWLASFNTKKMKLSTATRLRLSLEEAGPIFIKFGQLVSTRPDIFSKEITDNLKILQDTITPFDSEEAINIVETALGSSIEEFFDEVQSEPLASASIAQVYKAKLKKTDKPVVIKVVRPDIHKTIVRDISLMKRIGVYLENKSLDFKRLNILELIEEYEHVILAELDMRIEASNIKQTKRNFENNPLLHVPECYLDLCTKNILVMDLIEGIAVDDIKTLNKKGVDLKLLSERGVEIFLKQVFIDNFFHADMHPGNIMINVENPRDPLYVAVDYAIVGSLSEEEQIQIGKMILAVMAKDFSQVSQILIEAGWVDPESRKNDLEQTIRAACEPIFDQPMENINFGELLLFIFDSARRYNLQIPSSLMLLQKTLINIEGLGKQLYPRLDFWSIANPFLKEWISERYNPEKLQEWIKKNSLNWAEKARKLPDIAENALDHLNNLETYHADNEKAQRELLNKMVSERRKTNLILGLIILLILALITTL